MDKRHLEFKILEMKTVEVEGKGGKTKKYRKISEYRPSDRGHVMISEAQAKILNVRPTEKGMFYVLDKKNPKNTGTKHPEKWEVTRAVKNETNDAIPDVFENEADEVIDPPKDEKPNSDEVPVEKDLKDMTKRSEYEDYIIKHNLPLVSKDYKNKDLLLEAIEKEIEKLK